MTATVESRLDLVRRQMGLSRRLMLKAIGAKQYRLSLFTDVAVPDPAFLQQALSLRRKYESWKVLLQTAADDHPLSVREFAGLLGMSYQHAWEIVRDFAEARPYRVDGHAGRYQFKYQITRSVLDRLIAHHESYLFEHHVTNNHSWRRQRQRGPLAEPFVQWVEKQRNETPQG